MSVLKAGASTVSPSWMSIARRVFPSRLELKRRAGSLSDAPLAKVSFTTFLLDSPVQRMPSCDQTGVPIHFHSSTTSGSASLMSLRILARVAPRQSPSSAILFEMSADAPLGFRILPPSCAPSAAAAADQLAQGQDPDTPRWARSSSRYWTLA